MKNLAYISRKVHFCAAHRLSKPEWSKEKNEAVFGLCANENWHGHNYDLVITVKGVPHPDTGFVINFTDLKRIIKEKIIAKVDHKNLNLDVDFMKGMMPSTENLSIAIWNELIPHISGATLHSVKVMETDRNVVEYFGE